ncbi:hypothetical protein Goarm_015444 [Gossypium armourianum]|uniref:Glyoxal oxidase N-terminal domain-containing protein n=1 Tax=Gossypium armourianum TaxID=34283 RepID=A0A7J9J975_9ROSI|nr:hypothetical protein [Gossypium armourianum]
MHMQLLRNDRVIMFDRIDFGPSNLSLPNRKCLNDLTDTTLQVDCTAHSVEYNVFANKFRALTVQTDVWCSSGAIMPDETNDKGIENNLYPFVFLNVDENLFIFANNRAILFDYVNNIVVKKYPMIPDGEPGGYPSTEVEVLVCGGSPKGSYLQSLKARVMGDMILLPNGNVLLINGAGSRMVGWEQARDPVLSPVLYQPDNNTGSRFEVQKPTTIPRMYHSTAALLRDGRVLVGGSNPHTFYNFTGRTFSNRTKLRGILAGVLGR